MCIPLLPLLSFHYLLWIAQLPRKWHPQYNCLVRVVVALGLGGSRELTVCVLIVQINK